MRKKYLMIAMMFSSVLLTSCGPDGVNVVKPSADLQSCANAPDAPVYPDMDWSSVDAAKPIAAARDLLTRDWVASWYQAWGDCKSKVVGVKAWADGLD